MGSPRSDWTKRMMLATGVIVSVLGVTVLVSWHLHFIPLIQVQPTLAPMQRMTAVGFVLIGAALVLAVMGHRRPSVVCAIVVLVEAILVCIEYALNISLGIDQLLGPDYINVRTSNLGRMSPVTALCFLGSCIALLAISSRRLVQYASTIGGVLASVVIAVGTVSGLGYLLGHKEALWMGPRSPHVGRLCLGWAGALGLGLAGEPF